LTEEEQRREAEAQLAAADIEFVASNNNAQVRACHERAFKDAAGSPSGKVELSFTLGEEGRALDVTTRVNSTGSEQLARCLEQRVAEWRFPRPVGGAKTYQFPFVFLSAAPSSAGAP
jgi:TonB family protein